MKIKIAAVFCLVLIAAAACSPRTIPAPDPTAAITEVPQSAPPTDAVFTPIPTFTAVPEPASLSASLKLETSPLSDSGTGPVYTIAAQVPYLQGANDPRVVAFNLLLSQITQSEVDKFRSDILANQPVTPLALGSSFDMKYTLVGQRGDVWSIKFEAMYFYDGAAHPGHYSITLNYDLGQGREIAFDEMFLHGVNYLQTIAEYCKAQLLTRDIGFNDPIFQSGADPKPENYRNWNISDEGLVITFDEYQVAPYAAGPQTVVIPFAELQTMLSPQSALHVFSR